MNKPTWIAASLVALVLAGCGGGGSSGTSSSPPSVAAPPAATVPPPVTAPPVEAVPPPATTPPAETVPPPATKPPAETPPPTEATPPIAKLQAYGVWSGEYVSEQSGPSKLYGVIHDGVGSVLVILNDRGEALGALTMERAPDFTHKSLWWGDAYADEHQVSGPQRRHRIDMEAQFNAAGELVGTWVLYPYGDSTHESPAGAPSRTDRGTFKLVRDADASARPATAARIAGTWTASDPATGIQTALTLSVGTPNPPGAGAVHADERLDVFGQNSIGCTFDVPSGNGLFALHWPNTYSTEPSRMYSAGTFNVTNCGASNASYVLRVSLADTPAKQDGMLVAVGISPSGGARAWTSNTQILFR